MKLGMTKQQYYEMCELMGSEPLAEEIPVEIDDLASEVQIAMQIYGILQDNWDTMVGRYAGKKLENIRDIFDIWGIEPSDQKVYLQIIVDIDSIRMQDINSQKT